MAHKFVDECCGCATETYPCTGDACPNRNVKVLICDQCGSEAERLYILEDSELCSDCVLDNLEVIE